MGRFVHRCGDGLRLVGRCAYCMPGRRLFEIFTPIPHGTTREKGPGFQGVHSLSILSRDPFFSGKPPETQGKQL